MLVAQRVCWTVYTPQRNNCNSDSCVMWLPNCIIMLRALTHSRVKKSASSLKHRRFAAGTPVISFTRISGLTLRELCL